MFVYVTLQSAFLFFFQNTASPLCTLITTYSQAAWPPLEHVFAQTRCVFDLRISLDVSFLFKYAYVCVCETLFTVRQLYNIQCVACDLSFDMLHVHMCLTWGRGKVKSDFKRSGPVDGATVSPGLSTSSTSCCQFSYVWIFFRSSYTSSVPSSPASSNRFTSN